MTTPALTTPMTEGAHQSLPSPETKQPGLLYMLASTEMWERFSYYGMRAILIYYMMKALHFEQGTASTLYGLYTGFIYLTPLIGGFIADRVMGYRYAIIFGGIVMAIGQFVLTIQSIPAFTIGLLLMIVGNGFFKANISTLVGTLYRRGDSRRDGAFTIFYMGINVGGLLGPLVCGLAEKPSFGWGFGFASAGVGMILGLLNFGIGQKWLGARGFPPRSGKNVPLDAPEENNKDELAAPLTSIEKGRVAAIAIASLFTIFFWMAFEQAGNTMAIWADQFTEREVFGWTIPASWFQIVNGVFIVSLGPLFAVLWRALGAKKLEPSTPAKMAYGLTFLGVGFLPLVFAAQLSGPQGVKTSLIWLCLSWFLHTCGELCLSPVGLSYVTKLAPRKLAGMLMGCWFISNFVGNLLAGVIGALWGAMNHVAFFSIFVVSSLAAAAALFALTPTVRRLMGGVQ